MGVSVGAPVRVLTYVRAFAHERVCVCTHACVRACVLTLSVFFDGVASSTSSSMVDARRKSCVHACVCVTKAKISLDLIVFICITTAAER